MKGKALVTIWTDDIDALLPFYHGLLGLETSAQRDGYAELEGEGIRMAICVRDSKATMDTPMGEHIPGEKPSVGLTLVLRSHEEVDGLYADLIAKGALSVQPPVTLAGGRRVACIRDPEGNTHQLSADLPKVAEPYW
jgi:uncharacterized glyoxalase superfamily protein PhnB